MNREQLLLGGVLAIFALWLFAMREAPTPKADVSPGKYEIVPRAVKGSALSRNSVSLRSANGRKADFAAPVA